MKKIIIILTCLLLVVGCGSNTKTEEEPKKEKTLAEKIKRNDYDVKEIKCDALYNKDILTYNYRYFVTTDNVIYTIGNYSDGTNCKEYRLEEWKDNKIEVRKNGGYDVVAKVDKKYYNFDVEDELRITEIRLGEWGEISKLRFEIMFQEDNLYFVNNRSDYDKTKEETIYSYIYIDKNYKLKTVKYTLRYNEKTWKNDIIKLGETEEDLGVDIKDSKIYYVDYNYEENAIRTLATDKGYYEYKDVAKDNCEKYDDIKCEKKLQPNEMYAKYMEQIHYANDYYIILKDGLVTTKDALEYVDKK